MKFLAASPAQTKKVGEAMARVFLARAKAGAQSQKVFLGARVLALRGNLGAGKTCFVQGFARGLGVKTMPKSPTFVLMQIFSASSDLRLVHIDAYRLEQAKNIRQLGVAEIFRDPRAVVLVEWAERVSTVLPKNTTWIYFKHKGKNVREITIGGDFKF